MNVISIKEAGEEDWKIVQEIVKPMWEDMLNDYRNAGLPVDVLEHIAEVSPEQITVYDKEGNVKGVFLVKFPGEVPEDDED